MPWKRLPQYREMIRELRLNIELSLTGEELDTVSRKEVEREAANLCDAGCRVSMHGPFWDLNPGSTDPLIRHVARCRIGQFLDLFELFRPVRAVCHTGYDPRHHGGQTRFWIEQSLSFWEPMATRAEKSGTPLLIENVWEPVPDLHAELFQRLPSDYFGFCLDVGHRQCFSRAPLETWLHTLGGKLGEIHLHDNDGSGDLHLPVGEGSVDFETLFTFLENHSPFPLLTLEPHEDDHLTRSIKGLTRFYHAPPRRTDGSPAASDTIQNIAHKEE